MDAKTETAGPIILFDAECILCSANAHFVLTQDRRKRFRLASMQGAERNIEEMLHELNADFQQQRQMAITEELLDIVAGFEALKEGH